MKEQPSNRIPSQIDENLKLYESLAQSLPWLDDALRICSVPLRLTQTLVGELLSDFAPSVNVETFWEQLKKFGLLIQRNEDEWRLDREARQHFLTKLEEQCPTQAQQVHKAILDHLEDPAYPTLDEDRHTLHRAYHTTPLDQSAGADLYWSTYCRTRASNRFAMLPALAHLAQSQTRWLKDHEQDIMLYRAAALYYEGLSERKEQAAMLLEAILGQGAAAPITIDASFLLGTLKEQIDREEAAKLYEQATKQRKTLELKEQNPEVQHHLRLTLAKSFFNLASILQTEGAPEELERAELYYRHGIQIVAKVEPGYEATQLRRLIGVLQKRGEEDKIAGLSQRISQIEHPFVQTFLSQALAKFQESGDIGSLYYVISALNHGLGYERQLIRVEVEQDGSTRLEGTYTLRAFSTLSQIDTYLETVPESKVGVHFESSESLTPTFTLGARRLHNKDPETERLEIVIDPPMQPGDQLTYRWTARSSAGTISTTPQQLEKAKLDHEYVFWDTIAPMKRLEVHVVIPSPRTQPLPPTWFELWRVGHWHAATQVQTAYRAFLENDPSRVRYHAGMRSPDRLQLSLEVDYPWLAMRYVLAWKVV